MNRKELKKVIIYIGILFWGPKKILWAYGTSKNYLIKKICIFRLKHWCISISPGAIVSPDAIFPHPQNIVIGRGARISKKSIIYQGVTIGAKNGNKIIQDNKKYDYYPIIKEGAIIYTNSVIVGGITVGQNSIVGANSFVNFNVKNDSVVVGNPAKYV